MTFGKRLTEVRKEKKLSQEDVAKKLHSQGAVLGRYERDEVKPSIEMAVKLSQALEVSLDYLVGNTELQLDQKSLKRIEDISDLNKNEQDMIYLVIDALLRDFKAKQVYK